MINSLHTQKQRFVYVTIKDRETFRLRRVLRSDVAVSPEEMLFSGVPAGIYNILYNMR